MNRTYKSLNRQVFRLGEYSLEPIRDQDKFDIMHWRNEQIYHLRQSAPLTRESQVFYFKNTINDLFKQENPEQLLFSFLQNDRCIGYGGLVHINWVDHHTEISFIMDTRLEADHFLENWSIYLGLIEQVAFKELRFHKLFVYAFDLRPHLYIALEENGYFLDARLRDHCLFNGEFKDVVIYSKLAI